MPAGVDEGTWLSEERLRSRRPWYWIGLGLLIASIPFHQALVFVAGLLAIAMGAIPELWYRFCLRGLVYRRQLGERRVFFGEKVPLRVSVENRKLLPLPWLEVEDEFPEPLTLQGKRLEPHHKPRRMLLVNALSLWWFQRVTRRYTIQCLARGVFTLGPLTLRSGDPFGLLSRESQREQIDTLLVYPPLLPIERFGLPARRPFGERAAPRQLLEDPTRIMGVREWLPGDDLRRVHWKATARTMTLQSKVYEPTTTWTLAVFLNINSYANPVLGTNPPLIELAIAAAASVAQWATEQGYAVGLFANGLQTTQGEDELPSAAAVERPSEINRAMRIRHPPSSRAEQFSRILESLTRLVPFFGSPIEQMVVDEQSRLPAGATLVLISVAAAVTPSLLATLRQAQARGHPVALLVAGDAPVESMSFPIYRLGSEEVWHGIVAEAAGQESPLSAATPQTEQRFVLA
jgi:uncharacterized protein (DUF58 family)